MSIVKPSNGPGEFIDTATATEELNKFFNYREGLISKGVPWNPKSSFYAFQFSLENMQALINNVNAWNERNAGNPAKILGGIRVYSAMINKNGEEGPDVFLIPYYSVNNRDFVHVDKYSPGGKTELSMESAQMASMDSTTDGGSEDDGDMILGNGKRCPPHCNPPQ